MAVNDPSFCGCSFVFAFFCIHDFPQRAPGGLSELGLSDFGDKWVPCLDVASHALRVRLPSALDLELHQEEQEARPAQAGTGELPSSSRTRPSHTGS